MLAAGPAEPAAPCLYRLALQGRRPLKAHSDRSAWPGYIRYMQQSITCALCPNFSCCVSLPFFMADVHAHLVHPLQVLTRSSIWTFLQYSAPSIQLLCQPSMTNPFPPYYPSQQSHYVGLVRSVRQKPRR
jgi:hypothetical protein